MRYTVFQAIIAAMGLAYTAAQVIQTIRREYTCADRNMGFFWDGQKCESCSLNCLSCTSWNTCLQCKDGYGIYTDPTSTAVTCKPCTDEWTTSAPLIKSCCFNKGNNDTMSFHALTCVNGSQTTAHVQYGSVCHSIPNCRLYTKYGRCQQCSDGYFMSEDGGKCVECTNPSWTEAKAETEKQQTAAAFTAQYGNPAATANSNCAVCNGPAQCTQCKDNFYLASNAQRDTNDITIARSPSMCRQCNENCLCSNATNKCQSCLGEANTMYIDTADQKCKTCESYFTTKEFTGCKTCGYNANKELVCLTCNTEKGFIGFTDDDGKYKCIDCRNAQKTNDPFALKINSNSNPRIPGDPNCMFCTLQSVQVNDPADNTKKKTLRWTTCNLNSCQDSYVDRTVHDTDAQTREIFTGTGINGQKTDGKKNNCMLCADAIPKNYSDSTLYPNQAMIANQAKLAHRCKISTNNQIIITQCKSTEVLTDYTEIWHTESNKFQDLEKQYYLVPSNFSVGNIGCIKNINKCMKIKGNTTVIPEQDSQNVGQNICESCYPGFFLSNANKCITCDSLQDVVGMASCGKHNNATQYDLMITSCKGGADRNSEIENVYVNYDQVVAYPSEAPQGKCYECPTACFSCSTTNGLTTCNQCQKGYRLNSNNQCEKCSIGNCAQCQANATQCTQCFNGYHVFTNTFTQNNNGQTQTQTQITTCETCEKNCLSCDSERKVCQTCKKGYYLQSGRCQKAREGCIGYDLNNGICTQCAFSYRLSNGWCFKCFSNNGGFIDCPGQCQAGNVFSNIRPAAARRALDLFEEDDY